MARSHIAIIGAPLDLGQDRRGVDMGPSAVRVANLNVRVASLGWEVEDYGNIPVEQKEAGPEGEASAKYLRQIATACNALADRVTAALDAGRLPLVLGGDHSVAIGTVTGVARHFPRALPTGRADLARRACRHEHAGHLAQRQHPRHAAGVHPGRRSRRADRPGRLCPKVDPRNTVIVGLRDVDFTEKPHVRDSGVRAFTMRDIDERGLRSVMDEAIRIAGDGTAGIHCSLDMDFCDPADAPGVGTPVRGGATYREAHLAMEVICDSRRMVSLEVVEVNPVIDERNRTADFAVELIMSGLGKRIL